MGESFLVAHPFNPPQLIPLIEVVGGARTTPSAITRAMAFYTSLGKRPVHIHAEIPGHIANRLQAALFREIFSLLESGAAEVADIETVMEYGPGLRWGAMGSSLLMHLGGGPGGARDYVSKFMAHLMSWYTPKNPVLDGGDGEALVEKWVRGTEIIAAARNGADRRRDKLIISLLNVKERED